MAAGTTCTRAGAIVNFSDYTYFLLLITACKKTKSIPVTRSIRQQKIMENTILTPFKVIHVHIIL
jgi:hypothetical protein